MCAGAIAQHHKLVMDLGCSYDWNIAMEYDVQQHEAVALNPLHNLACLDLVALTIISTHHLAPVAPAVPSTPLKHSFPSDGSPTTPRKRHHSHCFGVVALDIFHLNAKMIELQLANP
jgi:hypothetical protein